MSVEHPIPEPQVHPILSVDDKKNRVVLVYFEDGQKVRVPVLKNQYLYEDALQLVGLSAAELEEYGVALQHSHYMVGENRFDRSPKLHIVRRGERS